MKLLYAFLFSCYVITANAQYGVIKHINNPNDSTSPQHLAVLHDHIYFQEGHTSHFWTNDGINGRLLATDSTGYGIFTSNAYGSLCTVNDTLYLSYGPDTNGSQLYKYDGINPLIRLTNLHHVPPPYYLTSFHNKLFFSGSSTGVFSRQLTEYNPATGMMKTLTNLPSSYGEEAFTNLIPSGNQLYFNAATSQNQRGLYSYNDSNGQVQFIGHYDMHMPCVTNNTLFFIAASQGTNMQLYKYTGNGIPTAITNFPHDSNIIYTDWGTVKPALAAFNDCIYFAIHHNGFVNNKLTYLISKIYEYNTKTNDLKTIYADNYTYSINPDFFIYNGKLYFLVRPDMATQVLYSYDGKSITSYPGLFPRKNMTATSGFIPFKGSIFFSAVGDNDNDAELYSFNDAVLSVTSVKDITTATLYPNPTTKDATVDFTLKEPATLQISLTDMQGRVVYNIPAKQYEVAANKVTLPMQSLSTGTYFYRISNADGKLFVSGKVVKE